MLIDTMLVMMLLRVRMEPHNRKIIALLSLILIAELAFFLSNLLKFDDGGWLPVAVAIGIYILMSTWQEGRRTLALADCSRANAGARFPHHDREGSADARRRHRGLSRERSRRHAARAAEQSAVQSRRCIERNVLLTFVRRRCRSCSRRSASRCRLSATGLCRIAARYGFMETPNVVARYCAAPKKGVAYEPDSTVYVVGRENPVFAIGLRHAAVAQAPVRAHGTQQPARGHPFRRAEPSPAGSQQPGEAVV